MKRKSANCKTKLSGFTLLELLVVVAIIGLLAALVGPRVFGHISKSEVTTTKAQIEALARALESYRIDVGHLPDAAQGLAALVVRPAEAVKWHGPYLLKEVPLDPWGHAYQYKIPGNHGEYDIVSFGSDGTQGGTGEAADVTN